MRYKLHCQRRRDDENDYEIQSPLLLNQPGRQIDCQSQNDRVEQK